MNSKKQIIIVIIVESLIALTISFLVFHFDMRSWGAFYVRLTLIMSAHTLYNFNPLIGFIVDQYIRPISAILSYLNTDRVLPSSILKKLNGPNSILFVRR